ncbi:hypothetical protein GWR56_05255 [Mucilaginibacter sp. 14171R-50]|uniref:hypothetical protein n=1 Tax=Mucilaginibacter sp. 14171R-50 TaxID=2703789 RepID=UPI00138BCF1E|nr:hypothetical protein [Mucilaginibacter sp. 14171R-50]QHS54975.1 hypothetical protein GWR56_05255 [Mucilaginibacter sp. 14171R-50]
MKPRFLFPHYFRKIGYGCFIAVILFAILFKILHPHGFAQELHHDPEPGMKLSHDITALLLLFGLLFIAFSKERTEDEHISLIRLESLQWAVYLNYFLLAVAVIFTNTMELMHIILMSVWAPLAFFIIRFRWMIYRLNQDAGKETDLS